MQAYDGDVALVTVTAPGVDVLPWDVANPTRIHPGASLRWNKTAGARWRELHRAAAQRARRKCGKFSLVAWSWEYQRRGALHKHLILGMATPRERAAAHEYVAALDELRRVHGFGYVDRGRKRAGGQRMLEVIPAGRASRYVAKYLSPRDESGKPTLSETVTRRDVPALVVYVGRDLTQSTGITMRYLRRVRAAYFSGFDSQTGETFASMKLREVQRLVQAGVLDVGVICQT